MEIDIGFLTIQIWDVLDWLIVAYLLYMVYKLLRGTMAFNIFVGAIILYLIWRLVDMLHMTLLSLILGKIIGVGVLLLIIIFQPEVRRFLLYIGNTTLRGRSKFLNKIMSRDFVDGSARQQYLQAIAKSVTEFSKSKTGALIVLSDGIDTLEWSKSGVPLDASLSSALLESIFFKNNALHDGAVIIHRDRITAAGCILPLSENKDIPRRYGIRHRAGIGVTEQSSASAIIVSEETGQISFSKDGKIEFNINQNRLIEILKSYYKNIN